MGNSITTTSKIRSVRPNRVKNKASYKDTQEAKGEAQDKIKCASNEHGHMTRSYAPPLSLDGAGV